MVEGLAESRCGRGVVLTDGDTGGAETACRSVSDRHRVSTRYIDNGLIATLTNYPRPGKDITITPAGGERQAGGGATQGGGWAGTDGG